MRVVLASNMYPSPRNPHLGIFVAEQVEVLERKFGVEFIRIVSARESPSFATKCLKYSELYVRAARAAGARADLVHMHYPSLPQYPAALLPALLRARPLVVTLHGDELKIPPLSTPRGRILSTLLRRVARVIAVSEENAALARAAGVAPERISVIHMGVNLDLFPPVFPVEKAALRAAQGLPVDRPVVLFVARLVPGKGFERVVEALSALALRGVEATLVVVGDGPEAPRFRALVERSPIAHATRWLGMVSHASLRPWFQVADLLALPSDREGMPIVVLEAMASGTPVIATPVGGLAQLIRDGQNGLLRRPADAAGWGAGIEALLRDLDLRERMARVAREEIVEHALEAQAERVFQVYASVQAGTSPKPQGRRAG